MRTKAKDQIRLCDGSVMTLAEALDARLVFVDKGIGTSRKRQGERREMTVYFAYTTFQGEKYTWEIGQKLYESRVVKHGPVSAHAEDPQ